MNPICSLENKDLLQFFHRHKTDIACMENPRIFLSQLRDHNLVPEDRYQVKNRRPSFLPAVKRSDQQQQQSQQTRAVTEGHISIKVGPM